MSNRVASSDKVESEAGLSPTKQVGTIVNQIKGDATTLGKGISDLAKAELAPAGKHAGIGAGLFAGAGYFAMNGLSLLFLAGALGLGKLFGAETGWIAIGFVVMAVVVFVLAGILALIGKGQVSKVKAPERTIAETKHAVNSVKQALARANADVKTDELERKTFTPQETQTLR